MKCQRSENVDSVFEKVKQIITDITGTRETDIEEDSCLDDLSTDSADLALIIVQVEEEYGIEISNEEALDIDTVGDIVRLIKEKGGE
jgi:acyl carrier protein